jgi:hypothetical protein
MKNRKTILALALLVLSLFAVSLTAFAADPNQNKTNPIPLPYSNNFNCLTHSLTPSLTTSSSTVKVSFTNLKITGSANTVHCDVEMFYLSSGGSWVSCGSSQYVSNVGSTGKSATLTFTGIPTGRAFYVRFSKSTMTQYYMSADFTIS